MSLIPYGRQDIDDHDVACVVEVLRSDWLTQGPAVPRFEEAMARYTGAKYATAVSNATAALHIACRALGLGPGDRLWTSPNTFVASANCGLYCGADVDFVDIDPKTYNMSIASLALRLERAKREEKLPKVVVVVHFAGQSCDMEAVRALSTEYGFKVIEDASHAVGARYKDTRVGSSVYSDMTIFSFHPVKIITTGEGGLILTNDAELRARVELLRSHGITRDPALMAAPDTGAWHYEQITLGYNYRMTDMQAALGASQMERLDAFIERRRALARRYDTLLSALPVITPWQSPDGESAWHLYPIQIDGARTTKTRREVFDALRAGGIGVNVHYIPVHTQPHYRALGFAPGDFPEAERYYARAISLPMYASLTDAEQDRVVSVLQDAVR